MAVVDFLVLCFSKNTSAEQQSSDRSKRGYMKQQNRRHVDRERECDLHSSRESEYDQLSTSDRQMVCFSVTLVLKFDICFLVMLTSI